MGHLLSGILYHEMTTVATVTTGQEPSWGHKFSILENFLPLWDSFLLGRACPKPCWNEYGKLEVVTQSNSVMNNPFIFVQCLF